MNCRTESTNAPSASRARSFPSFAARSTSRMSGETPLIPSMPLSLLSFLKMSSSDRFCLSSFCSANVSKSPTRLLCGTPDCAVIPNEFATDFPFSIAQTEHDPPR